MGFSHRIQAFAGMVPRTAARHLGESHAQVATNCRLTSGDLETVKGPLELYAPLTLAVRSIFRLADKWLTWDGVVDVVRAPIAGDTTQRIYYTGDGEPRVSNAALATAVEPYPTASYVLGVFPPTAALEAQVAGGSAPQETRSYVFSFVTPWGEESALSPASPPVTGNIDGTWTLLSIQIPPANSFAVTGGSWLAGIATLTVADTRGLREGETVDVVGVNPAGYNGTRFKLTAVDPGSISYALEDNPGAYTSGGNIARNAPHNSTGMLKRIYRTVTGESGETVFRFVKEMPAANVTIVDDGTPAEAAPSADWAMPPTDLHSLVTLPNGMMAGLSGKLVCFCEANRPYAWPVKYQQAMDADGVGCGVFSTTLVVATKANPYVYTAVDPAGVSGQKMDVEWPCLSKDSIASLGFGVGFATSHGYAVIGVGGVSIATEALYTEHEWQRLRPETMAAANYAGRLVIAYNTDDVRRSLIQIGRGQGAFVVQANVHAQALWTDPDSGELFFVGGDNRIYQWDADQGVKLPYDWMSREFLVGRPINLGAAKVDADFAMTPEEEAAIEATITAIKAANQALITANATKGSLNGFSVGMLSVGGSLVRPLPPDPWDSLLFTLYVDGAVKYSAVIVANKSFRLPAGYKSDAFAVRISGNVPVRAIVVAETLKDLAQS